MKRFVDVVVSVVTLVVLSPVLAGVALAVFVDSGFPVMFRQRRVGRGGNEFTLYKFRSMRQDASSVGPHFTSVDDPRITRVGKFIRRASLDELPQLVNVVIGDMSLVGPRPDLPEQRSRYSDRDWQQRCTVRPGITGLAQALYRSTSTEEQRLAADLRYTHEQSLVLDARIVWWTIRRLGQGTN